MTDSNTRPVPKPWISEIEAYVPGKSTGKDGRPVLKLSANENPLGTSPLALAARANSPDPSRYPDPQSHALRTALGNLYGLDPNAIVMGTGSDELLHLAAQGYAGPGDEIIYVRYGFSVYDIAARRCGAVPVIASDRDYGSDVNAILSSVTARTRVVFVANPNNPTGSFLSSNELARLHDGLPENVLLVVDQAYAEYVTRGREDKAINLAKSRENVLVTRTFSKIYGLAGERIGWATGSLSIIDTLNRIRGPFNVSGNGQVMALAALQDQSFIERSYQHNHDGRERFIREMAGLGNYGIRPLPSEANFVLVLFEGALSAETVYETLAERGIITRWLPNQGLAHALRITIGMPDAMETITRTIQELAEATR